MGVIVAAVGLVLNALADIEFDLVGHLSLNPIRRLQLRFLRVAHGRSVRVGKEILIRNRGNLKFGNRCAIGSYARFWNYAPIEIGDDFLTAGGITVNSASHDPCTLEERDGAIKIGNRVWCGLNVTILGGVNIGDDVVIGACSLINKDIPSNIVVAGVPARPVRALSRTPDAQENVRDYMRRSTGVEKKA